MGIRDRSSTGVGAEEPTTEVEKQGDFTEDEDCHEEGPHLASFQMRCIQSVALSESESGIPTYSEISLLLRSAAPTCDAQWSRLEFNACGVEKPMVRQDAPYFRIVGRASLGYREPSYGDD